MTELPGKEKRGGHKSTSIWMRCLITWQSLKRRWWMPNIGQNGDRQSVVATPNESSRKKKKKKFSDRRTIPT